MNDQPISESRMLKAGENLIGAAGLIAVIGAAMMTAAGAAAARRWATRAELPPRRFARQQWGHARAAMSAGTEAWRSMPNAGSDRLVDAANR